MADTLTLVIYGDEGAEWYYTAREGLTPTLAFAEAQHALHHGAAAVLLTPRPASALRLYRDGLELPEPILLEEEASDG